MYIALCDDQIEQLDNLVQLFQLWQDDRRFPLRYKTFQNASDLLDAAKQESFTSYFLDIMMPGMDGLSVAREIRQADHTIDIVFFTSSTGFAYESYSVQAMEYLLKPVRQETLFPILDRLALNEQRPKEGLTLKSGSSLFRILYSQLTYVEVNGKHIYFNLIDGSIREVFGTLKEYENQLLSRPEFMRVHRSYIVNMLQVAEFSSGGIHTFSGKQLPVSRLLYSQLRQEYMKLLFEDRSEDPYEH